MSSKSQRLVSRLSSFAIALGMTLAMLLSIDMLATQDAHAGQQMAADDKQTESRA
jgi:hypothetical protein